MAKRFSALTPVTLLHWLTQLLGWLFGGALALLFVGLLWLTASESGARWAVSQAQTHVPELSAGSVSGSLWGGLVVKDLHYAQPGDAGLTAEVGLAELGLAWWPFWRAEMVLEPLAVFDVRIELPEGDESAEPAPADTDPLAVFEQDWQLPVRVQVPSLVASNVQIVQDAQTIHLHHAHLSAQVAGADARLTIHQLNIETDDARLFADGAVDLGLDEIHQLDADLNFMASVDGHWLDGRIALAGALPQVEIRPELNINAVDAPPIYAHGLIQAGPERVVLDRLTLNLLGGVFCTGGELELADGLSGRFDVQAEALDPGWYDPELQGALNFKLDGSFDLTGEQPDVAIRLDRFSGSVAGESIEQLDGHIALAENNLTADLQAGVASGRLDIHAQAGLDPQSPVSLHVTATEAELAPFALPVLLAVDELRPLLAEDPRDLSLQLNADLELSGVMPDLQDPLQQLPELTLALRTLSLDVAGLADAVADTVEPLAFATRFELHSNADQVMLKDWALNLPGVALNADLQLEPQALLAELANPDAAAKNEDSSDTPPAWQTMAFDADLDLAVPHISALPWALIHVFAPELATYPTPNGALAFNLAVAGTALEPSGTGQLSLREFSGFDAQLQQAVLDFKAEQLDQATLNLRVDGVDFAGQRHLDQARLDLTGGLEQLTARLDAQSPYADAQLQLAGGLSGETFIGTLERLWVAVPDIAQIETTTAANFQANAEQQSLEGVCLKPLYLGPQAVAMSDQVGQLCLSAEHTDGAMQAEVQGDLALADLLLAADIPDLAQLQTAGRLQLDANVDLDADGNPDGTLRLLLPADTLHFADESLPDLAYQDFRIDAAIQGEQLNAQASGGLVDYLGFSLEGGYHLNSTEFSADAQLHGAAQQAVSLPALVDLAEAIMGTAIGPIDDVEGSLSAMLSLHGTPDAPRYDGQIRIEDLAFDSLDTGTAYHDGRIALDITEDGDLRLDGGLSGLAQTPDVPVFEANRVRTRASDPTEGRLTLSGFGSIADLPDWHFDLTIGGTTIPVLRLPVLALDARPDLQISARPDGADVLGAVHVPLAIAQVADLPQTAVTSSSDLVIEGQTVEEPSPPYALTGDVDLLLGDEISLRGLGFASRVAGGLEVILRPDDPLSLVGEISLEDGRYSALGQTLRVETGRLIFAGPPDDPGLDVSAIRELHDADNTVAGLKITGSLTEPVTEVFSRPPASQSDALSMLLTGRRLGQGGSAEEGALLMNAITGLGLRGGDTLAQQVGSAFGFDEFGIDTDNGLAGARLSVGRQITDDLLVRYAVGVFDGVGELITRYRINQALSIEVINRPEAQGGDVIYQFDRD